MKYAAIAALVAVVSAAESKCPKTTKTTFYTDKKCTIVDDDNEAKVATDAEKKMLEKGGCIKQGADSVKLECDAEGITATVYAGSTECKKATDAETPKVHAMKYTDCKKAGDMYYSFTGAAALKAAAIALVAIAGSQF